MSEIENDEPFIRQVESLIRPAEVSDLIFFSSLKKFIPPSLFKRVLYNTSKRYPRIGFVIEPYCLFLFFRLREVEKARIFHPFYIKSNSDRGLYFTKDASSFLVRLICSFKVKSMVYERLGAAIMCAFLFRLLA